MDHATLIDQYSDETKGWAVLLHLAAQDTSYSLSRCREVLESGTADPEIIRGFQSRFSAQEKIIIYLTSEIDRHLAKLKSDLQPDAHLLRQVTENQKKLQKEIRSARQLFENNNNEFLVYLNHTF